MSTLPARQSRSLLPDFSDFFAGFPAFMGLRPPLASHVLRLEDEMTDDRYVVRAEIPGIDPAHDVEISVREGQLTIKAERSEKKESRGRSEFSYGSFARTVSLPAAADEEHITATYDKGVLTISVPIHRPEVSPKRIEVTPAS